MMPDGQFIENCDVLTGRFINQADLDEAKKVVVIGKKVKSDLFKDEDPIDKYISVWGLNFKVVGVSVVAVRSTIYSGG